MLAGWVEEAQNVPEWLTSGVDSGVFNSNLGQCSSVESGSQCRGGRTWRPGFYSPPGKIALKTKPETCFKGNSTIPCE